MSTLTLFADRLCQTLLHSLWQTLAIVIVVSIVARLMQRRAEFTYAVSMAGLVATVVCMPVTFVLVSPTFSQLDSINLADVDVAGETAVSNDAATIPSPALSSPKIAAESLAAATTMATEEFAALQGNTSAIQIADTETPSAAKTDIPQQPEANFRSRELRPLLHRGLRWRMRLALSSCSFGCAWQQSAPDVWFEVLRCCMTMESSTSCGR